VGVEFRGVDALTSRTPLHRIARELSMGFFFWKKSLSAQPTQMRCHLRVTPFLPRGHRGYPISTSPCMSGETLGPAGPGSSVSLNLLLEGVAWYLTIQCKEWGGSYLEGATVGG
jgi:hypothetical protein